MALYLFAWWTSRCCDLIHGSAGVGVAVLMLAGTALLMRLSLVSVDLLYLSAVQTLFFTCRGEPHMLRSIGIGGPDAPPPPSVCRD